MPPDLHLHPDRLLAHAAAAAGLSEELRTALHGAPAEESGEPQRLRAAVGRAVRELAELSAALGSAAATVGSADTDVRGALDRLGPERA